MTGTQPIASVARALEVLALLIRSPAAQPLAQLHALTSIPKSSLLSILASLEGAGMAQRTPLGWTVSADWILSTQQCFARRAAHVQRTRRASNGQAQED